MKLRDLAKGEAVVLEHYRLGYYKFTLEPIDRVTDTMIRLTNGMRFRRLDGSSTMAPKHNQTAYRLLLPTQENKNKVYLDAEKQRKIQYIKNIDWQMLSPEDVFKVHAYLTQLRIK